MNRIDPLNAAIWGGLALATVSFWVWMAVLVLPTVGATLRHSSTDIITLAALAAAAAALKGERA